MTPTTEEQIAKIRERLAKTTPGKWTLGRWSDRVDENGPVWNPMVGHEIGAPICHIDRPGVPERAQADAELIANAPTDLQFLLDYLRRLSVRNEELARDAKALGDYVEGRRDEYRQREAETEWEERYANKHAADAYEDVLEVIDASHHLTLAKAQLENSHSDGTL